MESMGDIYLKFVEAAKRFAAETEHLYYDQAVMMIEAAILQRALDQHYSIAQAARALGMGRPRMSNLVSKYDLKVPRRYQWQGTEPIRWDSVS